MSSYAQVQKLAAAYRRGEIADGDLDEIALIRTGLDGNIIRQLARRLDGSIEN